MKRKRTFFKYAFGMAILFFIFSMTLLFLTIRQFLQDPSMDREQPLVQNDPFINVKKYTPLLQTELKKYELDNYTVVLAALMLQESKGNGGDPMQSSESAGLEPNTIKDPKESVKQGVKHFQRIVTYGKKRHVDFPTIIQSYNMGIGYINYIAKHGGEHSEQLAKQFSLIQVKKNPNIYDCGGNKSNFRYPYCYGDYTYSTKVAKNIDLISEEIPAISSRHTTNEVF